MSQSATQKEPVAVDALRAGQAQAVEGADQGRDAPVFHHDRLPGTASPRSTWISVTPANTSGRSVTTGVAVGSGRRRPPEGDGQHEGGSAPARRCGELGGSARKGKTGREEKGKAAAYAYGRDAGRSRLSFRAGFMRASTAGVLLHVSPTRRFHAHRRNGAPSSVPATWARAHRRAAARRRPPARPDPRHAPQPARAGRTRGRLPRHPRRHRQRRGRGRRRHRARQREAAGCGGGVRGAAAPALGGLARDLGARGRHHGRYRRRARAAARRRARHAQHAVAGGRGRVALAPGAHATRKSTSPSHRPSSAPWGRWWRRWCRST